jgi:hypothetical protein
LAAITQIQKKNSYTMSEWSRTTRECKLEELDPQVLAAIGKQLKSYGIDLEREPVLTCCQTRSTRSVKKLFRSSTELAYTAVLLTSQWLIWSAAKDGGLPATRVARLRELSVQDYESCELFRLMPDTGVNISGLRSDTAEPGTLFIGLGPEPAAEKFRKLMRANIAAA